MFVSKHLPQYIAVQVATQFQRKKVLGLRVFSVNRHEGAVKLVSPKSQDAATKLTNMRPEQESMRSTIMKTCK